MVSRVLTPSVSSTTSTLHEPDLDPSAGKQKRDTMSSTSASPEFQPVKLTISTDIDADALQRVHTRSRGLKFDKEGAILPAKAINEEYEIHEQLKRQASCGVSPYPGAGTQDDPFIVDWLPDEAGNPYNWSIVFKWVFVAVAAIATLCIAFASSCYTGAASIIVEHFHTTEEVVIMGVSLYVLGFGVGPLIWAPMSEMYGRRIVFIVSFFPFCLLHLGGALGQNIETVIVTRFLAGAFGSSMLTNAGAMISDVFSAQDRGLPTTFFALAPFLGPVIGPIVGGFAGTSRFGWRSTFWIMLIFSFVMYFIGILLLPETYAPELLKRRAKALQKASTSQGGPMVYYTSKYDLHKKSRKEILKINLTRPFVLLFCEPIVLLLSIYVAIMYGTLYLFFTAYPIVYQSPKPRGYGFSPGIGALPFIGIGVGMIIATCMQPISDRIYRRAMKNSSTGRAPPEARLPMACFGACCLPIGLFWFAWTSQPSVHWIVPILASVPFGLGFLFVFTCVISYLIDSYMLFAASALAANALLRAILACILPHVSIYMYNRLGNQWASTLVAFLSLICVPIPFLFYKYGPVIRTKSRYAPTPPPDESTEPKAISRQTTEKIRQPDEYSALEPEFAPDAGEHSHAPREMLGGIEVKEETGANAV